MSPGKTRVLLAIYGSSLNFAELEDVTGLKSSRVRRQGDSIQGTLITAKSDQWFHEIAPRETLDVPEMLRTLRNELGERSADLRAYVEQTAAHVQIQCVCEFTDQTPILSFDSSLTRWIADMGASLDVDLYLLDGV